jgi:hypothetical protein
MRKVTVERILIAFVNCPIENGKKIRLSRCVMCKHHWSARYPIATRETTDPSVECCYPYTAAEHSHGVDK